MSWRDVPMPTSVSSLPTDRRGFPVPWVSCWNSEHNVAPPVEDRAIDFGWGLGICPASACDHIAGRGEPDLGSLCPARQLEGMLDRLCDVCGEFIPPGPIYFMGAYDLLGGKIGFRECGVHYECALYAGQVCPGLVVPQAVKQVGVFECLAYTLQPELFFNFNGSDKIHQQHFPGWNDPDLLTVFDAAQAGKARMAVTGAFAVPINPTITRLSDWVPAQLRRTA